MKEGTWILTPQDAPWGGECGSGSYLAVSKKGWKATGHKVRAGKNRLVERPEAEPQGTRAHSPLPSSGRTGGERQSREGTPMGGGGQAGKKVCPDGWRTHLRLLSVTLHGGDSQWQNDKPLTYMESLILE